MISYEVYKVIHFGSIFLTLSLMGASLLSSKQSKWVRIVGMTSSLLIMVSGMGLMARIGIKHGEGFPLWIKGKFALWFLLMVGGPILSKRLKSGRSIAYWGVWFLATLAATVAVYRPL